MKDIVLRLMRGQQLIHQEEGHYRQHLEQIEGLIGDKAIASVKTRSPTPVLANDGGGGGFWLASVAAGAGAGAVLPPHGAHPSVMDPNCGSAETGFINSQPSMAEFMTALPQLSSDGPLQHSPGAVGPMSPGAGHHPGYHTMIDRSICL